MSNTTEWLYGFHTVNSILMHAPSRLLTLHVIKDKPSQRLRQLLERVKTHEIDVCYWSKQQFERQSWYTDTVHQGVIAEVQPPIVHNQATFSQWLKDSPEPGLFLILDGISDPHNLGACLRSAAAFGVHAVIVPKDKTAPLNAVAQKVACGATHLLEWVVVTNLRRMIEILQQHRVWIYGAAGEAEVTIDQINFTGSVAIVMGSEGKGLRRLTRETCDGLFRVPIAPAMESLNVSVATGVVLAEVSRQQRVCRQS